MSMDTCCARSTTVSGTFRGFAVKASAGQAGLGTSLIHALAKQLDARVETASDAKGTAVSMTHATFKAKPPVSVECAAGSGKVR
jgi:two-component sensor histidine kinase